MNKKKIMVAMSGGVDSSVAALLVRKQYPSSEVVGVTMKLWNPGPEDSYKVGGCCSMADIADAARVCRALGIKHYVFNYSEVFRRKVADSFLEDYLSGLTPNPCVVCNEEVKFGALFLRARALGFDFLATGHYARIAKRDNGKNLLISKARDEKKDQSYFLWKVSQDVLKWLIFPIGNFAKEEVRRIASESNLPVARKKESYDVCFASGDYRDFVSSCARQRGIYDGEVVDEDGRVVGKHNGIFNFTIGQRTGLGVSSKERLYVIRIEKDTNRIVVGPRASALAGKFRIKNCVLHKPYDGLLTSGDAREIFDVKIRYHTPSYKAAVRRIPSEKSRHNLSLEVEIKGEPVFGITPGQSAVFYDGKLVAGGGIIDVVFQDSSSHFTSDDFEA